MVMFNSCKGSNGPSDGDLFLIHYPLKLPLLSCMALQNYKTSFLLISLKYNIVVSLDALQRKQFEWAGVGVVAAWSPHSANSP